MGDQERKNDSHMLESLMYNVFELKTDMTDDCYNKICQLLKDFKEESDKKQTC